METLCLFNLQLKKLKTTKEELNSFNYIYEVYQCNSYRIEVIKYEYFNGETKVHRITAGSVACESYYPNIWYDDYTSEKIEISTTSYGKLNEREFDTFIKQQQEAKELAEYLKSYFLEERE